MTSVKALFGGDLAYGPAPESADWVKAWIAAHNKRFGLFINNQWVIPEGERKYLASSSPATGEVLCETIQGQPDDLNQAVAAARTAFPRWAGLKGSERARFMYAIARHIQKHARLFAVLEAMDNGKPIRESRDADVPLVVRAFYYHAGWSQLQDTELAHFQPLGVVGTILPWNFPLMLLAWNVAPALALGNTIVLKPASNTRLTALLFAEICAEAGLPAGVFNVITGPGSIGSLLAAHPDVDKIGFTGSTDVGRLLRRNMAGSGKALTLELGGKSPFIVFESADLDSTVEGVVDAIYFNQGQVCCAGSRLLVQESVYQIFLQKLRRRMEHLRVGESLDKCTDIGAVVDEAQRKSIADMVEIARREGCEIFQPSSPVPAKGCFFPPTLITKCAPTSYVVQEEIFGPVLVAMSFRTPDEAVALANNTRFGLAASVWTNDVNLAFHIAVQVKAGKVWVNGHNMFDSAAGFGGYRESGFGREGGREGLFDYIRPKWQSRPRPAVSIAPEQVPQLAAAFGTQANSSTLSAIPAPPSKAPKEAGAIDRTSKIYIGGKQARSDGEMSRPIYAHSGEVMGQVCECNRKDIRQAVEAAHSRASGNQWAKKTSFNRSQVLFYIAENLEQRAGEFAHRIVQMTGRSPDNAMAEVHASIDRLFTYAAWCDKFGGTVQETAFYGITVAIHEPIGVIGIACPDDFPLLGFISLVAPCIARGNSVVVVPSERYPLCATDMYQIFDTSDLPGGTVNIVTGARDLLMKTLVEHQDVDAVWYFGSAEGSAAVEYLASQNMKRTFVNYGLPRDWMSKEQGEGEEILREAIQVKNIWCPFGV